MDVSEPTPRVNFELMQRHLHKKVLLVGQIEGIENNVARLRAADGGTVQVMTKPGGQFNTQFVQFEGIVESPTQLHELDHSSFGDSLGKFWRTRIAGDLVLRLTQSRPCHLQIWVSTTSFAKLPTKTSPTSSIEAGTRDASTPMNDSGMLGLSSFSDDTRRNRALCSPANELSKPGRHIQLSAQECLISV